MAASPDPIKEWREQYGRRVVNLDFEPISDAPFRAKVVPLLPATRMAHGSFSPGFTIRDNENIRDGDDAFGFVLAQSRQIYATQRGNETQLRKGDATLVRTTEFGKVGAPENFKFLGLMIPIPELKSRFPAYENIPAVRRIPRQSEALGLLRDYVMAIERRRLDNFPAAAPIIYEHILDLVVLAHQQCSTLGETDLRAVTAARLEKALSYIGAHFSDPSLSLPSVARSQGISKRYLQRLIENSGSSFTAHVNNLRLEKAVKLLTNPNNESLRISDVALRCGFSDISYFNKVFRSKFGDTPSGVRLIRPSG